MTKNRSYYRHVVNDSGYIVMTPNVGSEEDLLQSQPPNPYAESATQQFPLGTKMIQGERVWRYCKNAANTVVIGAPLQSAAAVHADQNDDIVVNAATSSAIGSYTVTLTSDTDIDVAPWATKNGGAEGYLFVNDATGEGQIYKIKEHEAFLTTGATIITLYDPLTIALVAGASEVGLIQNPYSNIVVTAAPLTGMCVGVPLIPLSASYYFWSQTGGPAPVLANTAIALGTAVVVGTTASKCDPEASETGEVLIGYPLTPLVTTSEYFPVFLTLDR